MRKMTVPVLILTFMVNFAFAIDLAPDVQQRLRAHQGSASDLDKAINELKQLRSSDDPAEAAQLLKHILKHDSLTELNLSDIIYDVIQQNPVAIPGREEALLLINNHPKAQKGDEIMGGTSDQVLSIIRNCTVPLSKPGLILLGVAKSEKKSPRTLKLILQELAGFSQVVPETGAIISKVLSNPVANPETFFVMAKFFSNNRIQSIPHLGDHLVTLVSNPVVTADGLFFAALATRHGKTPLVQLSKIIRTIIDREVSDSPVLRTVILVLLNPPNHRHPGRVQLILDTLQKRKMTLEDLKSTLGRVLDNNNLSAEDKAKILEQINSLMVSAQLQEREQALKMLKPQVPCPPQEK